MMCVATLFCFFVFFIAVMASLRMVRSWVPCSGYRNWFCTMAVVAIPSLQVTQHPLLSNACCLPTVCPVFSLLWCHRGVGIAIRLALFSMPRGGAISGMLLFLAKAGLVNESRDISEVFLWPTGLGDILWVINAIE